MGILPFHIIYMGFEKGKLSHQCKAAVHAQTPCWRRTGRQPWRHLCIYHHEHRKADRHCPYQKFADSNTWHGEKQQSRFKVGNEDYIQHRCGHGTLCQRSYTYGGVLLFQDYRHALCLRSPGSAICIQHIARKHRFHVKQRIGIRPVRAADKKERHRT